MSLFGNAVQQVALGWLIYRHSHSATILGLVGFAAGMPSALVAPLAGLFADRGDAQRIMVWVQVLGTLLAVALALSVYSAHADPWIVLVLVCVGGIVNGIDTPVRQMILGRLVDRRDDVGSAVASSSIVYDGARLLGPPLGGIIVTASSEGIAFLASGLCHLFAIIPLLLIRLDVPPALRDRPGFAETFVQGLRFSARSRPILAILLLSASLAFAGSAYMVLMPIVAAVGLRGGAPTLGLLQASVGVGAIAGGAVMSTRTGTLHFAGLVSVGGCLFGFGLLAFALLHVLWLSMAALAVAGLGIMLMQSSCSTILLTIVDIRMRGRVMSLLSMSFMALAPLGSLCTGFVASAISVPVTIALSGALCLGATLAFSTQTDALRRLLRSHAGP